MKKIMKFCFVLFVIAMIAWVLDSINFDNLKQKSSKNQNFKNENVSMQWKVLKDSSELYWIPKNQILPEKFIHSLMNANLNNTDIRINKIIFSGTSYLLNFYGKKITSISISAKDVQALGLTNGRSDTIVLNKYYIDEAYKFTKELLTLCSLQKEICSKDEFCEAVFIHELWHLYNRNVDNALQEYYVGYQVFESKAKNFCLTTEFFVNTTSKNDPANMYNKNDGIVRNIYKNIFEIKEQTSDISTMAVSYKSLIEKYGFEGLIQKYKRFKKS